MLLSKKFNDATFVDTSNLATKSDLTAFKAEVG